MKAPNKNWEIMLCVLFSSFHPAYYSQVPIKFCLQDKSKEDKEASSWVFNKEW